MSCWITRRRNSDHHEKSKDLIRNVENVTRLVGSWPQQATDQRGLTMDRFGQEYHFPI